MSFCELPSPSNYAFFPYISSQHSITKERAYHHWNMKRYILSLPPPGRLIAKLTYHKKLTETSEQLSTVNAIGKQHRHTVNIFCCSVLCVPFAPPDHHYRKRYWNALDSNMAMTLHHSTSTLVGSHLLPFFFVKRLKATALWYWKRCVPTKKTPFSIIRLLIHAHSASNTIHSGAGFCAGSLLSGWSSFPALNGHATLL